MSTERRDSHARPLQSGELKVQMERERVPTGALNKLGG